MKASSCLSRSLLNATRVPPCRLCVSTKQQRTAGCRSRRFASSKQNGAETDFDFDFLAIGAGSGGVRASRFASNYGAKAAVCELPFEFISSEEKGGVGGTCVLRGCVPKKLMVYASEYAQHFKDSVGYGYAWDGASKPQVHLDKFMDAKRKELMRLNTGYKKTLASANVTLLEGKGKLVDKHTVEVDGKGYRAKNILIAVGGKATKLNIPGAEHCITSDEILELGKLPKKMTIIGGGYIALEFAGVFQRFGAEVHSVFRQPLPLRGFDEEVRKFIDEQFEASGLLLHREHNPVEVKRQSNDLLTCVIRGKDDTLTEITDNDVVLMATGRAPKTKGLGLETVGVKTGEKGEILVDEYSRTNIPHIWAVGDVTDRINLTPVALMEGMAVAKTAILGQATKPDYNAVASAVFSWPNMASVGITEEEAVSQYEDIDIYTSNFKPMKNNISGSSQRSFMKLIVDAKSDRVVGFHMVGDDSAEIMQGFAVALKLGVLKSQLDTVVGIHPSSAEEFVTMRTPTRKAKSKSQVASRTDVHQFEERKL